MIEPEPHRHNGKTDAKGYFRYTPRYPFRAAITLVVVAGAGPSWLIETDGIGDAAGQVVRIFPIFTAMFRLQTNWGWY